MPGLNIIPARPPALNGRVKNKGAFHTGGELFTVLYTRLDAMPVCDHHY
ncbi:hypothetical protein A225_2821 [Klebsiella michiganensis E718]|nr:hypothetical protein A225_2821 [Klebsiella michiganensis E718]